MPNLRLIGRECSPIYRFVRISLIIRALANYYQVAVAVFYAFVAVVVQQYPVLQASIKQNGERRECLFLLFSGTSVTIFPTLKDNLSGFRSFRMDTIALQSYTYDFGSRLS